MSDYKRFNRHEVFTAEDTSLVMKIIREVPSYGSEANMLFGLFDGYWYNELERALHAINHIPTSLLADLCTVLDKVQKHIDNSGSVTRVHDFE